MAKFTDIEMVVVALGDLKNRCLLTGGIAIPFYLTEQLEEPPRVTVDIDVALDVHTTAEFHEIETVLRKSGFINDRSEGAPICR